MLARSYLILPSIGVLQHLVARSTRALPQVRVAALRQTE